MILPSRKEALLVVQLAVYCSASGKFGLGPCLCTGREKREGGGGGGKDGLLVGQGRCQKLKFTQSKNWRDNQNHC